MVYFICREESMGNHKKDVRELMLALNAVSYHKLNIEYKVIYEYRYKPNLMAIVVDRKVIVFEGHNPIFQFRPMDDIEIITFLLDQMQKVDNGGEIKFKKKRKKKKVV